MCIYIYIYIYVYIRALAIRVAVLVTSGCFRLRAPGTRCRCLPAQTERLAEYC